MGEKLPPTLELHTPEALEVLLRLAERHHVPLKAPLTPARVLDKFAEKYVEPLCWQPTFVLNHPVFASPLAKEHRSIPGVVERFEVKKKKSHISHLKK
jgi:lysyl-tRNA synthetase, class II